MPITFTNHVKALFKDGVELLQTLTPKKVMLWHAGTGVCGEAGELIDAIKKHIAYNRPIDRENMVEELGDLEFYMEAVRQTTGITREETLEYNKVKLKDRYPKGVYRDIDAHERKDKQSG